MVHSGFFYLWKSESGGYVIAAKSGIRIGINKGHHFICETVKLPVDQQRAGIQ